MAGKKTSAAGWRAIMFAGASEIFIGLGLAALGQTDLLGPDMEMLSIVGVVMAIAGAGIALWARGKMKQADNRRGDLN